jgi:mono/diheme cytochrome c family protein
MRIATALLLAAGTLTAQTPKGDAANGKKLFEKVGCYQCHGHEGQGGAAGARIAPKPISFAAFGRYVRHPTEQMPPYTAKVLPDQQLADIYAFLSSIPAPPAAKDVPLLNRP